MPLPTTPKQKEAYREQGYVVVTDLFSSEELECWRSRLDVVEGLVGGDIASIHTMLINKPPGVDGRHPLHQDLLHFPFRPADRIVAAWTALERCTRENGCLVVVPGSQRGEPLPHENPVWEHLNTGYFGATGVGAHPDRVHLEMEPGDTVLFHPLLLHGSGRNCSRGFRRPISAHYASTACRYLEDGHRHGGRPYRLVRGHAHEGGILARPQRCRPRSPICSSRGMPSAKKREDVPCFLGFTAGVVERATLSHLPH